MLNKLEFKSDDNESNCGTSINSDNYVVVPELVLKRHLSPMK